jgi:hypothetical protein
MPVAWGSKVDLPTKYAFKLPRNGEDFSAFTGKYKVSCALQEVGETVDVESMWYFYRPDKAGCSLDGKDIVESTVDVTVSADNTTGKYPEYDKVWEDGSLRVVAIFGKFVAGATSEYDQGISAFNAFNRRVRSEFGAYADFAVTPPDAPMNPGIAAPDVAFTAMLPDGRTLVINALLVDEVSSASDAFYARYEQLSTNADLIVYNGHAGLGANIRTLAQHGQFNRGQYTIIFMNGCDTYTYIDGALAQKHMDINPDDPTGTKYMDMVVNAEPEFFVSDTQSTMSLVEGLLSYAAPRTYEQIFANVDAHQVVLVTGEQDNRYHP